MSRAIRSLVTPATGKLTSAPSALALDFGHPSMACYGQTVDGHDETVFNLRGRFFSAPKGRLRH